MQLNFALLLIGVDHLNALEPPTGPYAQNYKYLELCKIADRLNLPHLTIDQIASKSTETRANTVVFIAGKPSATALVETAEKLDKLGVTPIMLVDAFANLQDIIGSLRHLAEKRYQSGLVSQVSGLVKTSRLMLYTFAKSDTTTTIFVVVKAGTPDAMVLTILRDNQPFKGQMCFPGGFLDHHLESLLECCARETGEEAHVNVPPGELILLDVRSDLVRDDRGHVIDHGYMWLVPHALTEQVLGSAEAGDDAQAGSARFTSVRALLDDESPMAFDHHDLLLAAVRTGKVLPPTRPLLKLVRKCMSWLESFALKLEKSDAVYSRLHQR